MALRSLPVAEFVLSGGLVEHRSEIVEYDWIKKEVKRLAREAVKVDAQSAADAYHASACYFNSKLDFPPLRPPFPEMWIEWSVPDRVRDGDGKWIETDDGRPRKYFAVASEGDPYPHPTVPDGAVSSLNLFGGSFHRGYVRMFTGFLTVYLDADGMPIQTGSTCIGVVGETDFDNKWLVVLKPAVFAIGMMNCKNVSLPTRTTGSRSSKKAARKRVPRLDFHTIVLPGSRGSSGNGSGEPANHAAHKVRGHFKTYTEDAPLMGRHVGTYWWGWQARGNKRNGVTVTDYRIKAGTG